MQDSSLKDQARSTLVRERDPSECGVACLSSIAKYYGEDVSSDVIWELSESSTQTGTSLEGLIRAAQSVGLEAGGFKADLKNLRGLDAPCILHVTTKEGRQRYVVCYGTVDNHFLIGDPGSGVEEVHPGMLSKRWSSRILMTAEPTGDFHEKAVQVRAEYEETESEEEYRFMGGDAVPFGMNRFLVHKKEADAPSVLFAQDAQMLLSITQFDTLDNHVEKCIQALEQMQQTSGLQASQLVEDDDGASTSDSESQRRDVRVRLRYFVEEGLLEAKSDVRDKILASKDTTSSTPPPVTSICIPTAGRPQSLKRAIQSYAEVARDRDVPVQLVVVDDSEDAGDRAATRSVVQEANETLGGADLFYADREQRRAYADRLAREADVPPEVARFALLGKKEYANTYGAPRNAILLDGAGHMLVQVDDDTVADTAMHPSADDELEVTSKRIPREWWFFENRDEIKSTLRESGRHFLDVHEMLLGRTVGQCLTQVGDDGDGLHVGDVNPELLNRVSNDAKVRLSFAGAMGHCGRLSKSIRMFPGIATLQRMSEKYETYATTTEILRATKRPTITNGDGCVSMNVGIDNRSLMPPFNPIEQGEDQLFGKVLNICFHDDLRGYFPYSLLHDPLGNRGIKTDPIFDGFKAYYLMDVMMSEAEEWIQADGAEALDQLGRHLETIASCSPKAFSGYVRRIAQERVSQQFGSVEWFFHEYRRDHPQWADEAVQYMESMMKLVEGGAIEVPSDLRGGADEKLRVLQDMTKQFGRVLRHWPALHATASSLREQGVRIAERV